MTEWVTNCCNNLCFYTHVCVNNVRRRTLAKLGISKFLQRCIDKTQSYSLSEARTPRP